MKTFLTSLSQHLMGRKTLAKSCSSVLGDAASAEEGAALEHVRPYLLFLARELWFPSR